MAVAFALVAATPNLLRYRVTSAAAEAGNLDAAGAATPDLLTDCPPGPLRAVLAATYANQAAARTALLDSSSVDVRINNRLASATWGIDANVNGTALRLTATASAADATGSYLNIEHRHSMIR